MNDHYRKSKRAASFVPLTVTIIVIGIAVWFIYHNSSNCQQPPDKKISTLPGNKKTGVLLSEKIDVSTNEEWQAFSDIEQYHKSNPNK